MNSGEPRWYVVQTHPRAEAKAAAHLARQGLEVYLPRYLRRRRHARRVDVVAAPLFPRYLFVKIDMLTQRWRAIRSTFGVAQLVCQGDTALPVATGIVAGLRHREDERGYVRLDPGFVPGGKIRIVEGAFRDCPGLFEGMTDSERVSVLLDLLGRKVRLVMSVAAIEAA